MNIRHLDSPITSPFLYIGRGSKWGNPFRLRDFETRRRCVDSFKNYLLQDANLFNALHELDGKVLVCHCAPDLCHGNILIEMFCEHVK